ncbi:MAG TPA: efflux RND transporter periplasmic adaptor subunit [Luteibaculaceae bacterium]|nr:efflux RND transporter periplasmic adaptor subunit [Luteibaculaceae bacterium]
MKNFLYLPLALAVAACSSAEGGQSADLKKLEAERNALVKQQEDLAAKIDALNEQIATAGGGAAGKSALVTTGIAAAETFEHFFEVQGTLESEKNSLITAEMAGAVKRINVQEGQRVNAGQVLVELDKQLIDQSIAELKDGLELARFVFEKQEKLWKQNIGSELQYRQAKTNYESLQTRMKQAETQRSKTFITAPFSGVVEDIMPKIGEMAAPGMPVVRLVNLDRLSVKAQLSEAYVGKVKYGTTVTVSFPSIGKQYTARVTKVGSSINPSGRTFEVTASLNNGGKDLLPNLVAKVTFKDYENNRAIVVPTQAILQDINGNSYAYLVKKGKELPTVKKVPVKMGLTYQNRSEIISGLNAGDEIVFEGVRSINDGDRVSINKQ